MVFDLLTPVQGKFCRHRVSRAPEMMITAAARAGRGAHVRRGKAAAADVCMPETPIEVNWWKWSPIYTHTQPSSRAHFFPFLLCELCGPSGALNGTAQTHANLPTTLRTLCRRRRARRWLPARRQNILYFHAQFYWFIETFSFPSELLLGRISF